MLFFCLVQVTTDDVLILPPPSPSPKAESPVSFQTRLVPEEQLGPSATTNKKSKKPKTRPAATSAPAPNIFDKDEDFGWPDGRARTPSPEVQTSFKFGIPESYVRLEEMSALRKGKVAAAARDEEDDEVDVGGVNEPIAMDAAESLMELACVAPPPKRLK